MGELSRMTQFKEKSQKNKSYSTGLYTYPVLMAADILLYDTAFVPVGEDQKQHLELARDIATRFNNKYGDTFVIPEPLIAKQGARIMSLDDPSVKMSKSNPLPHSKIALLDPPSKIKKSIMKATTDSEGTINFDIENKAGVSNLLTIYSLLTGESIDSIVAKYEGQGYGQFKKDLVDITSDILIPIQKKSQLYLDSGEVREVLIEGSKKANDIAQIVLNRVKKKIGLVTF
jgi:tryptophanyl-tRNA synthetase